MDIQFESYGYIYKLTCLVNNKIYFGQTTNFIRRFNEYNHRQGKNNKRYNTPIARAINKYGFSNFKFEVVHYVKDQEELDKLEAYYILKYDSVNPKIGYNSRIGNLKSKLNETTRDKMSKSHIGLTEKATTKRKKSKRLFTYKDGVWRIFDSGKLFADYIGSSKDMASHAVNKCMKIRGYYVFREDLLDRDDKYKNLKDKMYYDLYIRFKEGVETRESIEYYRYE